MIYRNIKSKILKLSKQNQAETISGRKQRNYQGRDKTGRSETDGIDDENSVEKKNAGMEFV